MKRQSKPREAIVLLLDVGKTTSQQERDGQSFLYKSKQCASRIIQRKIFSEAVDEFSLILMGSEKSNNELDYPNINVNHKWLVSPNWNLLKDIENLTATDVNSADWLDGLIVAINLLKNESEAKKFTQKKIVMMSNFATPLRSKDHVDDVINSLRNLEINLVVIGPDGDQDSEDSTIKSKNQCKGEALVNRIVEETDGVICKFYEAMSQLDRFKKNVGRAQPWHCDLQIGGNIFIPVSGFKKFAPKNLLKWNKRSIDNAPITQETVFFQGDKQVDKTDVINSYLFGQTVVPISDDDRTSISLTTEKSFQLIGFTKRQNVPRHIFLGDSAYYIAPKYDEPEPSLALTALVKALLEMEMVAIVRKVYCKNSAPRLGALIPTCEHETYLFYYVSLPYAEDERLTKLPSLSKVKLSQAQLDCVDQLIEDMDLSHNEDDEDAYSSLVNPSIEHTNNMIVFKALNPNSKLPMEPSEAIKNLMKPKLELLENASESLDLIKKVFHLEELVQKNYRKGATDVFERKLPAKMEVEDVKPENLVDSLAGFVQSTVTEIGTVDPESNFLKLLETGEPFSKLCEQMQTAIQKLLLTSRGGVGIQKPFSALSLLRKQCAMKNPSLYNLFIASLKDDLVQRDQNEFWTLIVQDRLGLITSEESNESNINLEEANTFYQIKESEQENDLNYDMETEDLLDMI